MSMPIQSDSLNVDATAPVQDTHTTTSRMVFLHTGVLDPAYYIIATGGPEDSDISFQSSDGVIFKAHRILLNYQSQALPPPNCPSTAGVFILPESSSTLDQLFYYFYPHIWTSSMPTDLPLNEVLNIVRAIDKYKVKVAKAPWMKQLRKRLGESPVDVLVYAIQSGDQEFLDYVALAVIHSGASISQVLPSLPLTRWKQWVIYQSLWETLLRTAIKGVPIPTSFVKPSFSL
ncbi:hypothetical protein AX16_005321 [Volvariella volvacea WC 439]|nr:hypothetical protein AX16_005321 [Volvariella volvacea WC 439]